MEKKIINAAGAPKAVGPYSQAVVYNGLVYTSGTMPLDPRTGAVADGGIEGQARQALENLGAVLAEAGSSFEKVLKTTVFIKNMDDFAVVNGIYAEYFNGECPARSCVEVARLPKDILFEIECIAVCG
ncbi:RidA family protein [Clostridium sp. AM58-1XD]|uniref:RidA family protein n=1 Tax=Clostridium sp. AM58-1XD TaxID=2292307 RepID=UPI000E4FFE17|nr:RidA family protein [Clostridium sp. AM58-1XD]RGZ01830.1 RidA family protein [Clostridium sp. AM58-1XD]